MRLTMSKVAVFVEAITQMMTHLPVTTQYQYMVYSYFLLYVAQSEKNFQLAMPAIQHLLTH